MSPAASVEFRVPDSNHKEQPQPNPSSYSQYPSNPNLPSSFKFEYATASGVGNGSENCDVLFNSGRSVPGSAPIGRVQEVRSKPRLVKVRKGFGSRSLRSEAVSATSVDSGFNPFRSRSQSSISSSKISAASGEPQNFTFVFGESSSLGDPNSNSNGTYTDQKRGGSFVGIGNASAPEKEKLKSSSERENDKFDNFGLGNGRFNGSMKSEGSADTYKGGEFQNRAHSSFVFGATTTNVELNSTSCGGTQPLGESTASSGIFSGESEGGFSAFFVDTSGNHGMKENDKPGCGSNRRTGSVPGDGGNLSVGNDPLGKGVSSDRVGQACFVFKSSGGSYFTGRAGGTKMSDQIKVESSTHQGSISGDRCSTMNFFGIPSDVKLSEDLKKLNIDNLPKAFNVENAHCSTKAPVGANDTFTSSTRTMSTSDKMDGMKAAGSSKGIDEMNNGASVRPVDEHLFVFSASASYSSSSGVSSHCSSKNPENGEEKVKGEDPSSFPAFGLDTATKCGAYDTSREDKKVEAMDFKVPQWDTFSFSANMHNTLDGKSEHGVKSRMFKDTKPKKTKGKTRKHDILKQKLQQEIGSGKSTPSVNVDSTDCYSPMDFSPYQESTDTEQCSPEGSVKLNPLPFTDVSYTPSGISHVSIDKEDVNIAATSVNSQPKLFSGVDAASGDAGTGVHSNASHQAGDGSQVHFASSSETGAQQFMFGPASTQGHPLPMKRPHKKKYRVKPGHVPSAASAVHGTSIGTTSTDKKQVENDELSSKSNVKLKSMTDEERTTSTLSSVEAACEKWRLRGNQAYKNGELLRAEDFYTWGINCIPSDEASGFSVKPLVLCYSNRAATRMALGRIREALEDCLVAVTLDPCFLKAQIRAANCHLMLGELEEAMQNFNKCMESGGSICLDRKLVIVASDGLQRAKKVAEYISRAEGFLKLKTSEDADIALGTIAEGISISLYSEKLHELKAEALCLLQKYEDAIQLCEKTLEFADKNFSSISSNNCNVNGSDINANSNMKLWRPHILAKCYFHLGRLETALGVLDEHEGGRSSQDADPLVVTITELLKHKNAGNEAFRSGKHAEAVEHYTSAVSCSIESRPFAAVCFCNRAATYQILGQIADAISDCSVAMALDENYVKAVSRRANLHEKIRDYKQAASDLEKLVSILEKRSPGKIKQSGSSNQKELEQVYQRLSSMEEHAKKEVPLDLYLILGVKRTDAASEIKKAYRKAALKHHPDKAGQLLVRSESGVDGRLWKEIAESVHKDSDRLFKMIGEAYAVLSDPEKREEYDLKEDMRSESRVNGVNRGASRRESDFYGYTYAYPYPFERSTNRRHWQGDYKSKYSSTSRW